MATVPSDNTIEATVDDEVLLNSGLQAKGKPLPATNPTAIPAATAVAAAPAASSSTASSSDAAAPAAAVPTAAPASSSSTSSSVAIAAAAAPTAATAAAAHATPLRPRAAAAAAASVTTDSRGVLEQLAASVSRLDERQQRYLLKVRRCKLKRWNPVESA